MLSFERLIIDRIIDQVLGFTTVGNASKLVGVRDIGLLLPGCFVLPGASENLESSLAIELQAWEVIIIVPHQHDDDADGLTEDIAGRFMAGVFTALQRWLPTGKRLGTFVYQGRGQPHYKLGYAEFPMTFHVKASLIFATKS